MVDATYDLAFDPHARSANLRYVAGRVAIYGFLGFFALIYLIPLFVIVANSFRELPEITRNGLIAIPQSFSLNAWPQAWLHHCVAGTCEGIHRNFYNSLLMTIPATILSTLLGAINGYVLSKWRFPGSETLFACMTLGRLHARSSLAVALGVHSRVDRIVQHDLWAHSRPCRSRVCRSRRCFAATTMSVFPTTSSKPRGSTEPDFWRVFFKIILPLSPPILIVTVIWQFTGIWNEYLFGVVFTGGRQQPVTAALVGLATNSMNARSYDVASCAVLIAAIPPLLIYFFGGKYFVRGLTQGAIK